MDAEFITDGWLPAATHCPSPNCDRRPMGMAVDMLVVHGISLPTGEFGGTEIDALFCNTLDTRTQFSHLQGLRVSSHVLIRRDGELRQYVPFHLRAWHAGLSAWLGRENCNDFSIGIELEGTDTIAYTDRQYQQLDWLVAGLMAYYPAITAGRIVGHSDIAPGRKTDPGPAFDWQRLVKNLKNLTEA
ncbi:MAG TPA: 1,6-anhydro-N-acetylmuramyl-L-alanine amidase AmpD [Gammaproteobacteria bacterium]|nr:1,6-anhydro-N-acetylmuramyl-L-alanine amidase AmpD [Gammaproteobacteria bacterium]